MRLNDLHLTKFRIRFPYTGSTRVVRKAWEAANINDLWKQTMWARKVEAKKKVSIIIYVYNIHIKSSYIYIYNIFIYLLCNNKKKLFVHSNKKYIYLILAAGT